MTQTSRTKALVAGQWLPVFVAGEFKGWEWIAKRVPVKDTSGQCTDSYKTRVCPDHETGDSVPGPGIKIKPQDKTKLLPGEVKIEYRDGRPVKVRTQSKTPRPEPNTYVTGKSRDPTRTRKTPPDPQGGG